MDRSYKNCLLQDKVRGSWRCIHDIFKKRIGWLRDRFVIEVQKEKLVHLKMVVKFKVLIEKKKMCSLGFMRFDWWMWFLMVHLEELEMKKLLIRRRGFSGIHGRMVDEDGDGKKNGNEGLFNFKA
ncbi:hypothetical protein Tco_1225024 [Tanacetum coccineum]